MQKILKTIYQYTQKISKSCLPDYCLLCNLHSQKGLICDICHDAILTERTYCLHCGSGLTTTQLYCGECLQYPFYFDQLHAIANYQPPFPDLIKQLKYNNQLMYADLLGLLLAQSIKSRYSSLALQNIDYLIATPLHDKKHRQRGFNQAQLIAEALVKELPLTMASSTIIRNKQTIPQEGLTRHQRTKNLNNAFTLTDEAKAELKGKYIVLLDDVVTTGATINSLCQCLLAAQVTRIDVWCICRTEAH